MTAVSARKRSPGPNDARVVSLFPGATETVAALAGLHLLAGVSHECDYPPGILGLPRVTRTTVDPGLPSARIDEQVRRVRAEGRQVIAVDREALERLEPDFLITQNLCEVCAVADGEIMTLAAAMSRPPAVLSLTGRTLAGIEQDIVRLGDALDLADEARELVLGMRDRFRRVRARAPSPRVRVAAVEWLEPVYLAGHWVPEMVEAAGGQAVGAGPGEPSRIITPEALAALAPEVTIVMLCGFGVERALRELGAAPPLPVGSPVWVLDGNAYTSRPGPRLPSGAARIQSALRGRPMPGLTVWR